MTFESLSVRNELFIVHVGFMLTLFLPSLLARTAIADQKELQDEFWEKYPPAVERLKKTVQNLECEITFTRNSLDHHVRGWIESATEYGKGQKSAIIGLGSTAVEFRVQNPTGHESATVYCSTPIHTFKLEKSNPNTPFLIRYFGDDRSRIETNQMLASAYVTDNVFAAFQLFDLPIDLLLKEPTFRIMSLTKSKVAEDELIEIQFELPDSRLWYESGRFVVSPVDDWAVQNYEAVLRSSQVNGEPWIDSGSTKYQRIAGVQTVFPKVVEVTRSHTIKGNDRIHEKQMGVITSVSFGTVSQNNFRLPAFSVSDIPLKGTRRSLWMIIGLTTAAIIFGLIYRRLRMIEN